MTQAHEPKMQRPCPWCGGDASAHEVNSKDAPGWVHLTVVHRPGCLHRRAEEVLLLSAYDLEKWNRRADDAENEQLRAERITRMQQNDRMAERIAQIEAAQERKPLTINEIAAGLQRAGIETQHNTGISGRVRWTTCGSMDPVKITRAIEAAHGIKATL